VESPTSWNRATASLACFLPAHPEDAWDFLVDERLVRDLTGDRAAFLQIVREEDHDVTGPSRAARVASQLKSDGLLLPEAIAPDPEGATASAHARAWRARLG
jgi:hypothetical protein